LGAGDKVAIILTATGVGVLDITWDGEIQEAGFRELIKLEPFVIDEIGIAAGGGL